MNGNKFLITLLAMFVMTFAACNDDDDEPIGGDGNDGSTVIEELYCKLLNNQSVNKDGGRFFWAVEANRKWTLDGEALPEWLTVEPLQGRNGTTNVVLEFTKLTDGSERSFTLPFVLGDETVNITVKQVPEGGAEEEDLVCRFTERQVFGKGGGTLKCILQASADWTISEDIDWLTVEPMSGSAGQTELTLTATPSGGILRVGALTVTLAGEKVDLMINQSLNDTYPTLTMEKEAEVSGNEVTLYATCAFESDEAYVDAVGFSYRDVTAGALTWIDMPSSSEIVNGVFEFSVKQRFDWGSIIEYKSYAMLNGERYESDVNRCETEKRVVEDGVWYYENFDGMYDPETKTYKQEAKDKGYRYGTGELSLFNTHGGFLRKNQPNAQYSSTRASGTEFFRVNPLSTGNDGWISAQIKPEGVNSEWNLEEGTQLYPGASGNWKYINYYESGLKLTVTGLDFVGAGDLQLTFGCFLKNYTNKDELPAGILQVFVSVDGEQWEELKYSCISLPVVPGAAKYWRQVVINNIPDKITALRIALPSSGYVTAIDDIKMIAQP